MKDIQIAPEFGEEAQEEDILAIYGKPTSDANLAQLASMHSEFQPWHHPVKQIVRKKQWAALTEKLLKDPKNTSKKILKYFTLPGADLFDIRVLADVCHPLGIKIEYFGFNSGGSNSAICDTDNGKENTYNASWVTAESALLQAEKITSDAVIFSDRLEDIAIVNSHASIQLGRRTAFDVVNIDACDHLAYSPIGRQKNTFDAIGTLLQHQMGAKSPWLLFITTRAEPSLMGDPGIAFQNAITQNLQIPSSNFGAALAECLKADISKFASELASVWSTHDERFLKLYSIGIGKYLLQFFCAQPNLPANVELASIYAYRVQGEHPDMLSLAFRITPDAPRVFAPSVGGAILTPNLEPTRATYVATQAAKLQDLDHALTNEIALRKEAVEGTMALLESANYDMNAWQKWLANHKNRPMQINEPSLQLTGEA